MSYQTDHVAREMTSHKDELWRLYVAEHKPLRDIQDLMRMKGFHASTRAFYDFLVEKWGWHGFPWAREPSQKNWNDCEEDFPPFDEDNYYPPPPQSPSLHGFDNATSKTSITQRNLPPPLQLDTLVADDKYADRNDVAVGPDTHEAVRTTKKHPRSLDSGYGSGRFSGQQSAYPVQNAADMDAGEVTTPNGLQSQNESSEDDRRTIYSAASSLPPRTVRYYVSELCEHMKSDLGLHQPLDEGIWSRLVQENLPELFKSFAFELSDDGATTPTQQHRDATFFIHKYHPELGNALGDSLISTIEQGTHAFSLASEQMSPINKIALLWGKDHRVGYGETPEDLYDGPSADEDELETFDLPDYHRLVIGSPAYGRFLLRFQMQLTRMGDKVLTGAMRAVRNDVLKRLPSSVVSKQKNPIRHEMTFVLMRDQGKDLVKTHGASIGDLLTVTGTASLAQAATIKDYVKQTWPHHGESLLDILHSAIHCGEYPATGILQDGARVQAALEDRLLKVTVCGLASSVADVGEQLAWIGAAVHPVTEGRVVYRSPCVQDGGALCYLAFRVETAESVDTESRPCVPPSTVIVTGYPIRHEQKNHRALELSMPLLREMMKSDSSTAENESLIISSRPGTTLVRQMKDVIGMDPLHWRSWCDQELQFHLCGATNLTSIASAWSVASAAGPVSDLPRRNTNLVVPIWTSCPGVMQVTQGVGSSPEKRIAVCSNGSTGTKCGPPGLSHITMHQFYGPLLKRCAEFPYLDGCSSEKPRDTYALEDSGSSDSEMWSQSADDDEEPVEFEVQHTCGQLTCHAPTGQGAIGQGATGQGASNNSQPHETASSAGRTQPRAPQKKRRVSRGSEEDGEDDKPRKYPAKRRKQHSCDEPIFACPFYKHDPITHRSCSSHVLSRIRDTKYHMYRYHFHEYYCERCFETFDSKEAHRVHVDQPRAQMCETASSRHPDFETDQPKDQMCETCSWRHPDFVTHQEKQKWRLKTPKVPEDEQWYSLFESLFTGHPRPESPYINTGCSVQGPATLNYLGHRGLLVAAQLADVATGVAAWPSGTKPPAASPVVDDLSVDNSLPPSAGFSATNQSSGNLSALTSYSGASWPPGPNLGGSDMSTGPWMQDAQPRYMSMDTFPAGLESPLVYVNNPVADAIGSLNATALDACQGGYELTGEEVPPDAELDIFQWFPDSGGWDSGDWSFHRP